jgi:hypothetical protein
MLPPGGEFDRVGISPCDCGDGIGSSSRRREKAGAGQSQIQLGIFTPVNKILLSLIFLATAPSAHARWMTTKEAGSVVEKFLVDVHVQKSGAWTEEVDYTVRVQAEDAKTSSSIFNIEYNSFTDKVDVLEAYTLNGGNKIPVDPSAIEDRDKGEARDYDAMKVRSVVFPQVEIGSRLHIKYRTTTQKPLLADRWSDEVSLFPSVFVENFRLHVQSERPLYFNVQDPMGVLKVKQPKPSEIEARNRKPLPGWVTGEKDPYFHPASTTQLWISTHKDWREFLSGLNQDFEKVQAAGVPARLQPWLKEVSAKKTTEEKILTLMEKMSHDFRYFGDWRRHNGGLVPRSLTEIEKSRYGDCKDLASLLTSMLRALKIPANVALVRRGENPWGTEPDYDLPAASRFNHAIVRVQLEGKELFLDATNPVASLVPFPDISGRPAYILDPKGAFFTRLPPSTSKDFQHLHDFQYRFRGEDTEVRVSAELKKLAPYRIANELFMSPRSEVLTNTLEYFSEGQEVKSFHYIKEPQSGRALQDMKMALDYDSGRVTYNAGKGAFFVIPDGYLNAAFYETAERESDMKLGDEPFVFKGVRRLKDTRLAQDVPAPCRVDSDWMTLERTVAVEGHDVVISQSVDLKKAFIQKAEFRSPAFKKLQDESKRCFYRSGVLIEPIKG